MISWAIADNSFTQSLMFMQKANLFNVAITRGRNKVINFVSRNPRELPDGHFRNYVSYMQNYQDRKQAVLSGDIDENLYKNPLEREVAEKIRELDHKVVAGAEIAGLSADLLVDDKFVVEIDGVQDKNPDRVYNMKKQAIIERSGFKVKRITYREWQYSSKACLDRVLIEE